LIFIPKIECYCISILKFRSEEMSKKRIALFLISALGITTIYSTKIGLAESLTPDDAQYSIDKEYLHEPIQVGTVYESATSVTGTTIPNSNITIAIKPFSPSDAPLVIGNGKANKNGKFDIPLMIDTKTYFTLQFEVDFEGQSFIKEVPVKANTMTKVTVNDISDSDTTLTGTATPNSLVYVTDETGPFGTVLVDSSGKFSMELSESKQVGTKLEVYAQNGAGKSETVYVTITKQGTPTAPNVDTIYNDATIVTGTGKIGNTITIKSDNVERGSTKVEADGTFSCPIRTVVTGETLDIYATNSNGTSIPVSIDVVEGLPVLSVSPFDNYANHLFGVASLNSTIKVEKQGVLIAEGKTTNDNKCFSIPISTQELNTVLTVTASNKSGETSKNIVVSSIPGGILELNPVTSKERKISGVALMGNTISVYANDSLIASGKTTLNTNPISMSTLTEGLFEIETSELKLGTELTVVATNDFNESNSALGKQVLIVQ
jgi:hypothetical protein